MKLYLISAKDKKTGTDKVLVLNPYAEENGRLNLDLDWTSVESYEKNSNETDFLVVLSETEKAVLENIFFNKTSNSLKGISAQDWRFALNPSNITDLAITAIN